MTMRSSPSKIRALQDTQSTMQSTQHTLSHVTRQSSASASSMRSTTSSMLLLSVTIMLLLDPVISFSVSPPNQQQHPESVVRDQLRAFQDSNLQAAFRYASPENQVVTGPWENFEQLMYSEPAFQPIVGHEKATILMTVSTEDWGMCCLVRIVPAQKNYSSKNGGGGGPRRLRYHSKTASCLEYWWELTKQQDGKYKGCWMVDSVLPDFEDMSLSIDDMMEEEEDDEDGDVYFDLLDLLG